MSRPRLKSLGIALTFRADVGRRAQQPLLEQPNDGFQLGDVAVVGLAVSLVMARDLLARQSAPSREQVIAVTWKEIIGLAQHDLQPVPL